MPLDDSKILFSSNWEIDQILRAEQVQVDIPVGDWGSVVQIVDFSDLNLPYFPMVYLSWRRFGETRWNLQAAGSGMTDSVHVDPVFPVWDKQKLYVQPMSVAADTFEIRYVIFKNKALTWE